MAGAGTLGTFWHKAMLIMKGPPKDTTDGKSLKPNATNTIRVLGTNPRPASPTADAASHNK